MSIGGFIRHSVANKEVTDVVFAICNALGVKADDIMEYVPDDTE